MPGEVIPRKILILIHLFCTSTSSNSSCSLLFHRLKRRSPVRTVLPMKTLSGNGIRTKHNFPSPLLLSLLQSLFSPFILRLPFTRLHPTYKYLATYRAIQASMNDSFSKISTFRRVERISSKITIADNYR